MERVPRRQRIIPKSISLFDYEVPLNLNNGSDTTTNIQHNQYAGVGSGVQRSVFGGVISRNDAGDTSLVGKVSFLRK